MANIMLLFGSGGHSTEMLMLVQNAKLKKRISTTNDINKLICVISKDDTLIEDKLNKELGCVSSFKGKLETVTLKRARKVGQSYITACWTFLIGFFQSLLLIIKHRPDLCITNGPAISITISLAIRCLQLLTLGFYYKCLILYIESFCRTKTLSLSGKLIYHIRLTNEFYVQWPELCTRYPRAKYKGLLV